MSDTTTHLAQLIAIAADKELGVRPDGEPKRQDYAAAEAIEAEYLLIPRNRRNELAHKYFEGVYMHLPRTYREAIDRIIELEGKAP